MDCVQFQNLLHIAFNCTRGAEDSRYYSVIIAQLVEFYPYW